MEEDLDETDLAELMAEPPGGPSYGRRRNAAGLWRNMASGDLEPSPLENEPRTHGSRYTYEEIGCRCDRCRGWNAARSRRRRGRSLK